MTPAEELKAMGEHRRWVESLDTPLEADARDKPVPRFRDCGRCPLRAETVELQGEDGRRVLCTADGCPWWALPPGPSERTLLAVELAALPGEAIARQLDDLEHRELIDLNAVRQYRGGGLLG